MAVVGKHNSITDVAGIMAGNYTNKVAASGVTVILCKEGAVAGVDVRGAAPGTRETDLLDPVSLFSKRLERGRFVWPSPVNGKLAISSAQLAMLLEGIDWRMPARTWRPLKAG